MKFVLFCEKQSIIDEITPLILNNPSHELEVVSMQSVLDKAPIPQGDAYVFEYKSWNENYAVMKYLDLFSNLEDGPYIGISRKSSVEFLKGRLGKKDVMFYLPSHQDAFDKMLETFKAIKEKMDLLKAAMK